MLKSYKRFVDGVSSFLPTKRVLTSDLHRLAWGTDASFYRLIPEVVVFPETEEEVVKTLREASRLKLPVTFRASGTSLSGQSVSNSVLVVLAHKWDKCVIANDLSTVTMQPGIIGERVNQLLKPYGRRITPDPASFKSASIGGIVVNNASGMSCGVHANSDKTVVSLRIIFADGSLLDTGDADSKAAFARQKPDFLKEIMRLRTLVVNDKPLQERILYKYGIKNVTGLNIRPLAVYDDPFDIITHLMVGSEGTLGFVSQVVMQTAEIYPFKASAMVYFKDLKTACTAVGRIKPLKDDACYRMVTSAELLDTKALASVNDTTGEGLTAILIETTALTADVLNENIKRICGELVGFDTFAPVSFTTDEKVYAKYWQIRSGVFPAVGGSRPAGTTALIEDVAFHDENMPDAIAELQQLLLAYGYDDACIYGHALDGNVHFILNQSFSTKEEVRRYDALMSKVVDLVVDKYDGSLKAEHGTGRNMAPFVRREWGDKAYEIMKAVKRLFDPDNLLNQGVIFNDDPECHLKNLKPLPLVHHLVDKCIECGFCEVNCLTCGFTLSSRQRIIARREISRLRQTGDDNARLQRLIRQYRYPGEQTCAGDGLCSTSCPMEINVGELTHVLRSEHFPANSIGYKTGDYTARHLSSMKKLLRFVLFVADFSRKILGFRFMRFITKNLHILFKIPLWTPSMPKPTAQPVMTYNAQDERPAVVYFPSCLNQTMGLSSGSNEVIPAVEKTVALFAKAGYRVIFPEGMDNLCCGTIWESKGMADIADRKTAELESALRKASRDGAYPIVCDQSPCLHRMRSRIKDLKLYEPVEFIYTFLRERLDFHPIDETVSIHVTCSMRRMGLTDTFLNLARLCAKNVVFPDNVGCCGFAGDKGFTHPEVNDYALRNLRNDIERNKVTTGYCNSRTCEIGLASHSGIDYKSIVYLVDACTTLKHTAL
ncbi:MAG: FAD-binding oxidoreductase [Tannerella sp.]|jgi:D-lactate dehydrogenase|nr:FAD-binding oxidoreductase [Tannerella sp.]